jgi:5-enolpyruvylshikimate-3-phosphate synthase
MSSKETIISNMLKPVDIDKFEEACLKIGVNIKNDDGTYRRFIDVIQDMSNKFNEGIE